MQLLEKLKKAAGRVMHRDQLPASAWLLHLLASRGLFALLAALLLAALLGCSCLAWHNSAQIYDLQSALPTVAFRLRHSHPVQAPWWPCRMEKGWGDCPFLL